MDLSPTSSHELCTLCAPTSRSIGWSDLGQNWHCIAELGMGTDALRKTCPYSHVSMVSPTVAHDTHHYPVGLAPAGVETMTSSSDPCPSGREHSMVWSVHSWGKQRLPPKQSGQLELVQLQGQSKDELRKFITACLFEHAKRPHPLKLVLTIQSSRR